MSGSMPQPAEPGAASPVDPVAPIDRTGGYLGPNVAAAVGAASRATPARWRLLLRKATFWIGATGSTGDAAPGCGMEPLIACPRCAAAG